MSDELTWGVVATVAEPAPLIQAFVAHHLALGASQVHLYFDDPEDPAADCVEGVPGVYVTRCDRRWWRRGLQVYRPKRQNNRQTLNATHAQSICGLDYILHTDADEFLRPGSDMAAEMAGTPGKRAWVKVRNLERAFEIGVPRRTIFDGVFKCYSHGVETPLRTGPMTPFGFTGHAAGKAFSKVAEQLNLGIHVPRRGHIRDRNVPPHHPAEHSELAHFDGLTPLHWAAKFVRQAAVFPTFLAQLPDFRIAQSKRIFAALDDPKALSALYDEVNGYTPQEVEALTRSGHMIRTGFDPGPALAATFPGQAIDLSPAHFDALLRPRLRRWRRMAKRNGII